MRAALVGCAIIIGCGGHSGAPVTGDADVDIDAATPNGTKIMFTLKNAPGDALAFGFTAIYQDGTGAWKPAPHSGDTYAFDVSSATWGFAYTCQVSVRVAGVLTDLRDVVEYHFAVAERTSMSADILSRCTDRIAYVELTGNISNRPAQGTYRVAYGDNAVFIDRNTGNYDMLVTPGTHDLLVLHGTDRNTTGDFLIDAAIVQRNVAVNAAMTLNVNGNNAAQTKGLTISVSGGASMKSETTTNLFTANGTAVSMAHLTKTPLSSTALAGAQAAATDVYDQRATVMIVANQPVTATSATAAPANLSLAAPMALGAATTTSAATTPYPMFRSTWPVYPNAIGYTWTLSQTPPAASCNGSALCTIMWTAWISPGAAGATPSYAMPDLSQLQGWNTALQFVTVTGTGTGSMATGEVSAMTSSAGAMDFPPSPPVVGTKRVFAHATFAVKP
jgi:hypothetical protein